MLNDILLGVEDGEECVGVGGELDFSALVRLALYTLRLLASLSGSLVMVVISDGTAQANFR